MAERSTYPSIDMVRTGIHLKNLIAEKGYAVKDIQSMLNLSCPQPVYRWFKGRILPSVDHLLVLSKILGVHMEELLVPKQEFVALKGKLPVPEEKFPAPKVELLMPKAVLPWPRRGSRYIYLFRYWMFASSDKSRIKSEKTTPIPYV